MNIQRKAFGHTHDGHEVSLYTLTNDSGSVLELTNFGAIITRLEVPDRLGKHDNIVLGFSHLDGYLESHPYFGATIGRYANRIAKGKFLLAGQTYTLAVNNGVNHLHGGLKGFDKRVWHAQIQQSDSMLSVVFRLDSADGDEGYPGAMKVEANYTWSNSNELTYSFTASCDQATFINLTNHAYWNLLGSGSGTVLNTQLRLSCDRYLPVDSNLIPTGELIAVDGSAFDFRAGQPIGQRIAELPNTQGYDHCFVINGTAGTLRPAAEVYEPTSGRLMELLTTQPGIQLYTGNYLDGTATAGRFHRHGGFCLETQHFPDSPNQPHFPSTRLDPRAIYFEKTVHRFSTR